MEKINLLSLPTPLQKMNISLENNIYIKRDDLTDFVLGGNKARKIEYYAKDIIEKQCDCIVTYGSFQSNHCRIVASLASRLGKKCVLILEASKMKSEMTGNMVFYKLAGADIIKTSYENVAETIENTMKQLQSDGYNPYFITGGGHSYLGTRAYVKAYEELVEQSKVQDIEFDYIFVATGTGTTHAGLIIGNKVSSCNSKVVGISVARKRDRALEVLKESLEEYQNTYKCEINFTPEELIIEDKYIGEGYGDIYPEIVEVIKEVIKTDSIILDPVYTGKAFYGMKQYLENNNVKNKNILFIHTGGLPCLFENAKQFK